MPAVTAAPGTVYKPLLGVPPRDVLVMGIDPSLTSTGIALLQQGRIAAFTTGNDALRGPARLDWFYREFVGIVQRHKPAFIALEGYGFGAKSRAHSLGELGGVLRLALVHTGIPFIEVPPTTLKTFATGAGNAEKSVVSKELFKRYGIDLSQNDEVDAAACALIAYAWHFPGSLRLTKPQVTALGKLALPANAAVKAASKKTRATGCKIH